MLHSAHAPASSLQFVDGQELLSALWNSSPLSHLSSCLHGLTSYFTGCPCGFVFGFVGGWFCVCVAFWVFFLFASQPDWQLDLKSTKVTCAKPAHTAPPPVQKKKPPVLCPKFPVPSLLPPVPCSPLPCPSSLPPLPCPQFPVPSSLSPFCCPHDLRLYTVVGDQPRLRSTCRP